MMRIKNDIYFIDIIYFYVPKPLFVCDEILLRFFSHPREVFFILIGDDGGSGEIRQDHVWYTTEMGSANGTCEWKGKRARKVGVQIESGNLLIYRIIKNSVTCFSTENAGE